MDEVASFSQDSQYAWGLSLPVGYNIGVVNTPAAVIKAFCNESVHTRYGSVLDQVQLDFLWSAIVSIFLVGAAVGSLGGSVLADKIGRKGVLSVCAGLYMVAAVFFFSSKGSNSIEMLILGRLVVGLASETHPDLPPLNQGTISKIEAQYREMGHGRKVPSKRQAVVDDHTKLNLLLALEENPITPAHQLARDSNLNHKIVLKILKYENAHIKCKLFKSYLKMIQIDGLTTSVAPMYLTELAPLHLKGATGVLCPLGLTVGVLLGQIASMREILGNNEYWPHCLALYSLPVFFSAATIRLLPESPKYIFVIKKEPEMALVVLQKLRNVNPESLEEEIEELKIEEEDNKKCVGERWNIWKVLTDRTLLLPLTLVCSLQAGQQLSGINSDSYVWVPYLSIVAVLGFVICYGIGMGPIPYFIGSELFEVGPRPSAMALGSMSNWGANFIIGITFPTMQIYIGPASFFIFASITIALSIFIRYYLPETRGRDACVIAEICQYGFASRPLEARIKVPRDVIEAHKKHEEEKFEA
ncbi:hypothetical protein NQ318_007605 [Aromia moschata]|uniref:Major facilitator superfamily (MFS) profile domain-containing protein n=1 Tax=Aromia moschata TaxID=1265417 RepID=A0AAV8YDS4_9CUCU|nr:hypothetical protein NQ318_007605 [Aromia moschata]